jgi:hypothetical protein
MFTYIWDVLVPEVVVIRLLMEVNCIEYSEAEVLMSSLPQEMKNAESESSDADDFFVSLPTKRKKQQEQEEPSDLLARSGSIAKGKRATLNKNRRDAVMVKLMLHYTFTVNTVFLLSVPLSIPLIMYYIGNCMWYGTK